MLLKIFVCFLTGCQFWRLHHCWRAFDFARSRNWVPWCDSVRLHTLQWWSHRPRSRTLRSPHCQSLWCHLSVGDCLKRERVRKVWEFPCHKTELQVATVVAAQRSQGDGQGEAAAVLPDLPAGSQGTHASQQVAGPRDGRSHGSG